MSDGKIEKLAVLIDAVSAMKNHRKIE